MAVWFAHHCSYFFVWIWTYDNFRTIFDTTGLCATASVAKLNPPLGLSVGSLTNVITFHLTFPHWWCSRDSYSRVISGHSMIQSPSVLLHSLARRLRDYFGSFEILNPARTFWLNFWNYSFENEQWSESFTIFIVSKDSGNIRNKDLVDQVHHTNRLNFNGQRQVIHLCRLDMALLLNKYY